MRITPKSVASTQIRPRYKSLFWVRGGPPECRQNQSAFFRAPRKRIGRGGENQRGVALNHDNYNFSFVGREKTPTGFVYILAVEPRTQNKLLYRGRIWVDATDFAVMRIEAEPAKNPSFWT